MLTLALAERWQVSGTPGWPVRVRNQFDLRVEFGAMQWLNKLHTAGVDIVFPYIT